MRQALQAYLPMDRRQALLQRATLPDRTVGAALFADISGFTPLTEALARSLGPLRGAEELTRQLAEVFTALIAEVHRFRGSVIGFSGDAITCWFDGDDGSLATASALAMQAAMQRFVSLPLPGSEGVGLAVKAAVVKGPVRRLLVGDPQIQVIDVLAGRTLDMLAAAEHLAQSGEVVVADETLTGGSLHRFALSGWRQDEDRPLRVALVQNAQEPVPDAPWPPVDTAALEEDLLRPWVLPAVYERLRGGLGHFLADFRPAAALFLSFWGIDYDEDDAAGEKLDSFVRWVQAKITAYEGALVQLTMGDKGSYLYAAFGAPIAHDDDAVRAVAVALELLHPPKAFDFIHSLRIGVTHGQMYTGAYGSTNRSTYGVLSAKTNLAARLMGKAREGQILCDEEVYRQARRRFHFERLPAVQVKGKAEAVQVYAPSGVKSSANSEMQGALLGRDEEVSHLEARLASLLAGRGQLTFLEGEAGIGKSRLVQALLPRAEAQGARVLRGTGQDLGQSLPYQAWHDVFSAYFGLEALPSQAAQRTQVERSVAAAAPRLGQHLPLLNDVLNLGLPESELSSALDPSQRQEQLFELLIELLRDAASKQPLLLVLEDAQRLDSLSWELSERVARALLPDAPLWLLIVNRPLEDALRGKAVSALRDLPNAERLELPSLAAEALLGVVSGRLGIARSALPAPLATLMQERANGNPFVAEELVQNLRDQGLVTIETSGGETRCRLSSSLEQGTVTLPNTLQGLILSRLDRLPLDTQLILKAASVIGRAFAATPLHEALKRVGAQQSLQPTTLHDLIGRGFILEAEAMRYLFKHIMTQEVAYQTLLFSQRRQLHRALAEWYEQEHQERLSEVYPILAHHYSQAAEGSSDPELLGKAADYLTRAGQHLTHLCAYPEAIATLKRGLDLLPVEHAWYAKRAELLVHLGEVYENIANYPAATEALQTCLELAEDAHEKKMMVKALTQMCTVFMRQGAYQEARGSGERALALAREIADRSSIARAQLSLGKVALLLGEMAEAAGYFKASLALFKELADPIRRSDCLNNLGMVSIYQKDYEAAASYFHKALAIARETGQRTAIGRYLTNLGLVAEKQRDLDAAEHYYEESLSILRETGAREAALISVLNLACVAAAKHDDKRAHPSFLEALTEALALGALPLALDALLGITEIYAREGRLTQAAGFLGLALAHPASDAETQHNAEPVLASLQEKLPAGELEAAMAAGKTMRLEEVASTLLQQKS